MEVQGDPHTGGAMATMAPMTQKLTYLITKELSQKESPTIKLIELNISSLPEEAVELLHTVERLSLQRNQLTTLPTSFRNLTKLRYLDLHGNRLAEIPAILLQCPHLEIVDLSSNEISALPQEYSPLWCSNVKVLSLKNNRVRSLRDLYATITQLKALTILEIDGNKIPKEELDHVTSHVPTKSLPPEEYWLMALRKYMQDFPQGMPAAGAKTARAAKRMGFIGAEESGSAMHSAPAQDSDLISHSKYNDYFKRLSVLPEETSSSTHASASSETRVSHEDLVVGCRKLLFSFTECQQNIRKITSLCADKSVAVNMVSLLYTVRSHIDNLVEVLEQAEDTPDTNVHDQLLVNLCVGIISVFKQIISLLRKNFDAFFRANDVCFTRMFYMTLLCSYTEMCNVWNLVVPENIKRKRPVVTPRQRSFSVQTHHSFKHLPPRQRSNTLQRGTPSSSALQPLQPPLINQLPLNSPPSSKNTTPLSNLSTPPPPTNIPSSLTGSTIMDPRADASPRTMRSDSQIHSPNIKRPQDSQLSAEQSNQHAGPSGEMNIDTQLYHTLRTVIGMVNVVYAQLTQAIQKTAIASTTDDHPGITPAIAAKIKDLTETCFQSMELSKVLKSRLSLITSTESEQYNTNAEKLNTWEDINAFLKSIIAILANTKLIMKDLPVLNEVRPNLASLAKITKDVTVILDMSSYRTVSASTQPAQQPSAHGPGSQLQTPQEGTEHYINLSGNHSINTPLSTPSLVTSHVNNPFDQL
ncbi:FADR381Cp [Eremothecium gossypii FDAG1]|nr:FADR381Cp [Eremothecium gossypii FDAG1]